MIKKTLFLFLVLLIGATGVTNRLFSNELPYGVETEITEFIFDYADCGCDLGTFIDPILSRVRVRVPFTMDLTSVAPTTVTIPAGATIAPDWTVARDWTQGPVDFVVTSADGQTIETWSVLVENPPCNDLGITAWNFMSNAQVWSYVNQFDRVVTAQLRNGHDLSALEVGFMVGCGSSLKFGGQVQTSPFVMDFSQTIEHQVTIYSQTTGASAIWTIKIEFEDILPPVLQMDAQQVMNCDDGALMQCNERATIFLFEEQYLDGNGDPTEDFTNWAVRQNIVDQGLGYHFYDGTPNRTVFCPTTTLYQGRYFAIAIDNANNLSDVTSNAVTVDMCTITVQNLTELRTYTAQYKYILQGEIIISYEEDRAAGNWKFAQDNDAGIQIIDRDGVLPATYGIGTGLSNICGFLGNEGSGLFFIPTTPTPTISSTNNQLTPIDISFDEFAECQTNGTYESMLARITTPVLLTDDYDFTQGWDSDGHDLKTVNAEGDVEYYLLDIFTSPDYVGTVFAAVPTVYTGIRTSFLSSGNTYGSLTPRFLNDISAETLPILKAQDDLFIGPVDISACAPQNIEILNEGGSDLTVTAATFGANTSVEFSLVDPTIFPLIIPSWGTAQIAVNFCPVDAGTEVGTLDIVSQDQQTVTVDLTGLVSVVHAYPFYEDFNNGEPLGWVTSNMLYGNNIYNLMSDGQGYYYGWSWVTPQQALPAFIQSPAIDLSNATDPWLQFYYGTYFSADLKVEVSTDKTNWTTLNDYGYWTVGNAKGEVLELNLNAYAGSVIYIRWIAEDNASYFGFDNIYVGPKIVDVPGPKIAIAPEGDFGSLTLGETNTLTFSVTNIGESLLHVKSLQISGSQDFTLTDNNTYAFEVFGQNAAWSTNGGDALNVDVQYAPTTSGDHSATLTVIHGFNSENTTTWDLTGTGLDCANATPAVLGENFAPSQDTWWTYTAANDIMLEITSCDPRNTTDPYTYSYDTFLSVYDGCGGNRLAENDDIEWAKCSYNRAVSGVVLPLTAGQTIKIFWPWAYSSGMDDQGFFFHLNAQALVAGDICENAIPLTLPVFNLQASTDGFFNNYDYIGYTGNDVVYTFDVARAGTLSASVSGKFTTVTIFDQCPIPQTELAFAGGVDGGQLTVDLQPGTYFAVISSWAPPQSTNYTLNMSFYSPINVQRPLNQGWSWFSVNVVNPDMTLASVLSGITPTQGDYIKSQMESAIYYDGIGWFGSLAGISPAASYKIRLAQAGILDFDGEEVDLNNAIQIVNGWNWVSYLPQTVMSVTDAMASINPVADDYVKNQTVSTTYINGTGWLGNLTQMIPLDGYMLKCQTGGSLQYPGAVLPLKAEKRVDPSHKSGLPFRVSSYELSGQVTTEVSIDGKVVGESGDYLITMADNKITGISEAIIFPHSGLQVFTHLIYANINDDPNNNFYFYQASSNQWYRFESEIKFESDMVKADAIMPFRLTRSEKVEAPVGNLRPIINSFSVYPNPVSDYLTIELNLSQDQNVEIEILDATGRVCKTQNYGNRAQGACIESMDVQSLKKGVYYVRIKNADDKGQRISIIR